MATNKKDLKGFIRYDGNGRIIPGGNILSRKKPKMGKWEEIPVDQCCSGTSFAVTGHWFLLDTYTPPNSNGQITLPDHANSVASLNPNLVGLNLPTSAVMFYINLTNFEGVNQTALANMAGRSGHLTLIQNGDSVTYSFTADSFHTFGGFTIWFDWLYSSGVLGSLTIEHPSSADFNATDPITISLILD